MAVRFRWTMGYSLRRMVPLWGVSCLFRQLLSTNTTIGITILVGDAFGRPILAGTLSVLPVSLTGSLPIVQGRE
jgi:hypothetical protein